MTKTVVAVADTVLGYGSSQILSLTKGIAQLIGGDHLIFQPFVPHREYIDLSSRGYRIETVTSVEHPWSWIGRIQYLRRVAYWLNDHRPDVLILPNYNIIPILDLLRYRPKKIVHLALEDLEQFGSSLWGRLIVKKIESLSKMIDLWVFPETNRALVDCHRLNIPFERICIFYNISSDSERYPARSTNNRRVLYAGSVDFSRTVARYFSAPTVASQPIDVFGGMSGDQSNKDMFLATINSGKCNLRYFGEVRADVLSQLLPNYAYSLVYWFPITWALRNAAPNKFFQALAAGVPIIAAPHPQCKMLIKRYGCGIVLKDWEFSTFLSGIDRAIGLLQTLEYEEMAAACRTACAGELNWQSQFQHVEKILNWPE